MSVVKTNGNQVEDEVQTSDHTYRKSMWLQEMSDVKQTGGKGETENGE